MSKSKIYKQKTIVSTNATEFDELMNAAFDNISTHYSDINIHYYSDGFKATITYLEEQQTPVLEISNPFKCCDCIYYLSSPDKRRKYVRCTYPMNDKLIRAESTPCDLFYQRGECANG